MPDLNSEQLAVVNSDAPRILCPASAGSGKSRVGVEWIKRHIATGIDPKSIIAISFTNAASNVLQERLGSVRLGVNSTLHSFLLRLLQKWPLIVGLPERLSVIDDDAREGIVETIISEMGGKVPVKQVMKCLYDQRLIENSRGSKTKIELVAIEYHKRLRSSGLLDFQTVLIWGYKLIQIVKHNHPELWPYAHCFFDEIQDSAPEDYAILNALPCKNILAVGDDKQSCYAFRGARFENMIALTTDPGWTVLPLTVNYRCKSKIQEAANRLISHNENQIPIKTQPFEIGGTVIVESFDAPSDELAFVANELTRSRNGNGRPADNQPAKLEELKEIAVLCRTNPLAESFASYLEGIGIPVAKRKTVDLPADWRKAKLLLTVMANPYCDLAVHQFIVAVKGKSEADVYRRSAAVAMVSLYNFVKDKFFVGMHRWGSNIPEINLACLSHESRERIHDACRQLPEGWTVPDLLFFLKSDEDHAREQGHGVFVGTVHSAKGKEWKTVFLVGIESEWYPGRDDLDESRRLLYVGITRGRQRVVLTHCKSRPQWRGVNVKVGPIEARLKSAFLQELGLI